jgi:hypothetical protein
VLKLSPVAALLEAALKIKIVWSVGVMMAGMEK